MSRGNRKISEGLIRALIASARGKNEKKGKFAQSLERKVDERRKMGDKKWGEDSQGSSEQSSY